MFEDCMTNQLPLVTISIPSLNSAAFLERCLKAIREQDYPSIEINIVDGGSTDGTVDIAEKYNALIIRDSGALLGARYKGVLAAKGEFVLLLDSDQILRPETIKKAVSFFDRAGVDMLVLEEGVYQVSSVLEWLFACDRKLVHAVKDFDPYTSVMLPRMYKKEVLERAFAAIPEELLSTVGGQDHAIIYLEASKVSQKVDLLESAVDHIEPNSFLKLWKKFYRWGQTSVSAKQSKYDELLKRKERFRKGMFSKGYLIQGLASCILLVAKGLPFYLGRMASRSKV